ncbi:MAG: phosphocholine cytidylyltransferase family protein [Bacillota bacterium]|nr:phosphocholine cytidylyltransferase family protein [Bacillota bacterium]
MKAILMAAGRGSRISRHIGENPKCTLDVGGTSLIRHTVGMLNRRGIRVIVILGYRGEVIREELKGLDVSFYVNPFYDVTNSIASLWFARDEIDGEDLIVANADVYWDEYLLDMMLADPRNPVMLGDSSRLEEGDYRFKWDENDILLRHGKDLQMPDITGEYVGVALIRSVIQDLFRDRLETMIQSQQHGVWWENILYSYIGERPVYVRDVKPHFWGEVDYIEDYYRILAYRRELGAFDGHPMKALLDTAQGRSES